MLNTLKSTINALRDPETGCPWDLEQTHSTLVKYLIEECYEFIDTVENKNFDEMKDELGDLLLQIFLHSKIAEENNFFKIEDVFKSINDKMHRRHPHVFGNLKNKKIDIPTIKKNWEKIKEEEKKEKLLSKQLCDEAEKDRCYFYKKKDTFNPALKAALNIGEKSRKVNFDWEDSRQVAYKVEEEWQEVKEELASSKINKQRIDEEIGDLLFSIAQLARHLDIDPEQSLRKANIKFINRFKKVEDQCRHNDQEITQMSQEQLEKYWNIVKQNEIQNKN